MLNSTARLASLVMFYVTLALTLWLNYGTNEPYRLLARKGPCSSLMHGQAQAVCRTLPSKVW